MIRGVTGALFFLLGCGLLVLHPLAPPGSDSAHAGSQGMTDNWIEWAMPWDDSEESIASAAFLNEGPAGAHGFLTVDHETGDFVFDDGTPVRFWGTQVWTTAAHPDHTTAEGVAGRLAKHGINLVRVGALEEHLDESEEWDNFCYFVKELKNHGIYLSLQMIPGSPGSENKFDDLIDETRQEYFKTWITDYLTRENLYTGLPLKDDPVVALVEIANENSIARAYSYNLLNAHMDHDYPALIHDIISNENSAVLDERFSRWLLKKYGDQDLLALRWNDETVADVGENLILNGGFEAGINPPWSLSGDATYTYALDDGESHSGERSLKIDIAEPGSSWWSSINLGYWGPLALEEGKHYTVGFWAKCSPEAGDPDGYVVIVRGDVGLKYGNNNGIYIEPSEAWQYYQTSFIADRTIAGNGSFRLAGFAYKAGSIWLDEIKVVENGVLGLREWESLADGNVWRLQLMDQLAFSVPRYRDTIEFYVKVQRDFLDTIHAHLTDPEGLDIGVPVSGSQEGGHVGAYSDSVLDYMDMHSYYNSVTGGWGDTRSITSPESQLSTARGDPTGANALTHIAVYQRKGMPLTVSEHNVLFPHEHRYEDPLLMAAYSAYHGWDGITWFNFHQDYDETWADTERIPPHAHGMFTLESNPQSMVQSIQTAVLYRRGDVQRAQTFIDVPLTKEETLDTFKIGDTGKCLKEWGIGGSAYPYDPARDLDWRHALLRGVRVSSYEADEPKDFAALQAEYGLPDIAGEEMTRFVSDTGELVWDVSSTTIGDETYEEDHFIVNTPRSQSISGRLMVGESGRELSTDNLKVLASWPEYGAVTLTSMENTEIPRSPVMLISGLRQAANVGAEWVHDDVRDFLDPWGDGDAALEPVNGQITLIMDSDSMDLEVFPLDVTGQRTGDALAVSREAHSDRVEYVFFMDGPANNTVWYEIQHDWACPDLDGDGYPSVDCGGDDCDDSNPSVSPGMAGQDCSNAPDGVDDDCDGTVDEDQCGCFIGTLQRSSGIISRMAPRTLSRHL